MDSLRNSDKLYAQLMDRINGESEIDYTMNITREKPPLNNLANEFRKLYPKHSLHSKIRISEMTDPVAEQNRSYPKLWIEVGMIVRLIPDFLKKRLIKTDVSIKMNDGAGSYYDPQTMTISIKGAQDFMHEIGHFAWNSWLIRGDEKEKREAVNKSLSEEGKSRIPLPHELIPDTHKEYSGLIGTYSGQFIENPDRTKLSTRKNDLEEHFARNFDYLMRGRPLDVTYKSKTRLKDLLKFYTGVGLTDTKHTSFYRYLLKACYDKKDLNLINPANAVDGVEITRNELYRYHKLGRIFETGKNMSAVEEISLALDLSEDFIKFCISKGAMTKIREALKQKGITVIKI